ncbi:MAG: TIGR02147 family protein [Bdellovibrionales bacterium]|jgi:uncharacterized protein (TIGR02147 family)|nr:TIGR02147 family protein [Bdellovibrionales bacterium]MBT3525544.1 TIGR02147 family protein [Bdellovibrionales bacterium]MBT7667930.1 TIGR02147 family protein [Bdellovibrionales bacterium]MBT7767666.1 TIGR02147 family protein [Bdellovibrionales bacterium]
MSQQSSFLNLMQQEFESRSRKNPLYSLRAYAKSLDVEPSFLSKLLNQKRKITKNSIYRFGARLGLSPHGIRPYLDELENSSPLSSKVAERENSYSNIEEDQFNAIADWYHYAILELTKCDDFCSNTQNMAMQLDITYGECLAAINRLKRLGMLIERDGALVCADNFTTTKNSFTSEAFKTLQCQIIKQSQDALERTPFEERSQSSMTMAINGDQMAQAQKLISKFRRELTNILESGSKKSRVYQLNISLFPVSHNPRRELDKELQ